MKFFSLTVDNTIVMSLPLRECGLKLFDVDYFENGAEVTPFAGVWIEIAKWKLLSAWFNVTPFAGVWIEIPVPWPYAFLCHVTPFAGVWIEMEIRREAVVGNQRHSLCGSVD